MRLLTQLVGFAFDLAIGLALVLLVSWVIAELTTETVGWIAFAVFGLMSVLKSLAHAVAGYRQRTHLANMRKARRG